MGVYVTSTAYYLMLPGFLKDNTAASTDTNGVLMFDRQVLNAESIVNASISPYYSIADFTAIPPVLRKITEDVAIYNIIKATGYRADDRNEYLDDFKSAMEILGLINDGKNKLTYTDGSIVPVVASTRFLSSTKGYTPITGLDDQRSWKRDENEIDDQSAARD